MLKDVDKFTRLLEQDPLEDNMALRDLELFKTTKGRQPIEKVMNEIVLNLEKQCERAVLRNLADTVVSQYIPGDT